MRSEARAFKVQLEFRGENSMANKHIEEFARILVNHVRDAAIRDCDMDSASESSSVGARRWRDLGSTQAQPLMSAVIPDCVDTTLFWLLDAIDQGIMNIQFVAEDGSVVDLVRDGLGELAGSYIGNESWRSQFSKEILNRFTS